MAPRRQVLLEVGCGAGNLVFPLLSEDEQDTGERRMFIYACDFSPRAVQLVKKNPNYDESRMKAFECDITAGDLDEKLCEKMNIVSLVFVMSAIKPEAFAKTFENLSKVLSDEGILLFRDYAVNDMVSKHYTTTIKLGIDFFQLKTAYQINFLNNGLQSLCEQSVYRLILRSSAPHKLDYIGQQER